MKKKLKIIFFVGRNGGDYFALKKAVNLKLVDLEVVYMIASSKRSKALKDFRKENKNYLVGNLLKDRDRFFKVTCGIFKKINFDYILLCGFTYLFPKFIVDRFKNRIINSHHSILPAHSGLFRKERIITSDDKFLGATLHFVDNGVDSGRKLYQAAFVNYGIRKLNIILKKFRFIQDVMIVQLIRDFSGYHDRKKLFTFMDILFSPAIDEEVIKIFAKIYFDRKTLFKMPKGIFIHSRSQSRAIYGADRA